MVSTLKVVAAVIIVIIAVTSVYATLTFSRDIVGFAVSFTIGADGEQTEFEVPLLHDKVQVEVTINSGSALWKATIANLDGDEIWSHRAAQGDLTTYRSNWISLPSGHYNFTFGTIGLGGLQANIRVFSKGGFW